MTYTKTWTYRLIFHFNTPIDDLDELSDEEYELLQSEIERFEEKCRRKGGVYGATNPNTFDRKRLELICNGKPEIIGGK